jgi:hypothetical protein
MTKSNPPLKLVILTDCISKAIIKSLQSHYLNPKIDITSKQLCENVRPKSQAWRRDKIIRWNFTEQSHTCSQNESQLTPREAQHHICCSLVVVVSLTLLMMSLTLLMMTHKNYDTTLVSNPVCHQTVVSLHLAPARKQPQKTLVITNFAFSFVLSLAPFASPSLQQELRQNFFKQCLFVGATQIFFRFFFPQFCDQGSHECAQFQCFFCWPCLLRPKDIVFMGCIHTWC